MQEKDIRQKLNQELEQMAPDMLNKILQTPIEPVKNERELFGRNKPLFKEKRDIRQYFIAPAIVAIAACIVIAVMILRPVTTPKNTNLAFQIIVDVNPSISIDVDKDGIVQKVSAGNKDAKKIVKQVREKLNKDTGYTEAVELVVKKLNKNGYLDKKKNAMLLSVVSNDREQVKEEARNVKSVTKQIIEKRNIKCKTLYQNCDITDEVKKVSQKNDVSFGKAILCMKLAEKEKISVKKMCSQNIDTLIQKVEEVISVDLDYITMGDDLDSFETESILGETESVEETESFEEMTEETTGEQTEEMTTQDMEESESIEVSVEIPTSL
ncbi:hypothetical protein [uncultured Eubacterium sp.]|uniref:anti-sigma-I factor RsgI family protein n=1 Tax=uncultured Eubacterium sp. TaxID=165185 RepID=UPI0026728E06|nr:hypothetical protein [uncultured Eubacterium sp.]